ncbi:MAG: cytochrome c oxidase subunit 3 [Tenacibaculum sp.]
MNATVAVNTGKKEIWSGGGVRPFGASYGKMMMWFFILSDALTFSGFLAAYGLTRFKFIESWPIADEVFTHIPFFHGNYPMIYVAFMTFILIVSSVTMVLAVDAGHQMKQKKVAVYLFATIVFGLVFVGSQAWEWKTFIKGSYGAIKTSDNQILQFVKDGHQIALSDFVERGRNDSRQRHSSNKGLWYVSESPISQYTVAKVQEAFKNNPSLLVRTEKINPKTKQKIILSREQSTAQLAKATKVVEGANLIENEYGNPIFADFFFFITGFHGFHVFSGIVFNFIIFLNVVLGIYEKRGHYEMVEKVGLYWHFVDLVWVFVFTFFYLV